jgi:hypothetical protein
MFGTKEYSEYVRLQELADNIWRAEGDTPRQAKAQNDANDAYEHYEYASGLKMLEDY